MNTWKRLCLETADEVDKLDTMPGWVFSLRHVQTVEEANKVTQDITVPLIIVASCAANWGLKDKVAISDKCFELLNAAKHDIMLQKFAPKPLSPIERLIDKATGKDKS